MSCKKARKSKHLLATLVTENRASCGFCRRNVDDEVMYGKLYAIGDIQCHYFCALLSSCLIQKGKDEEGLFGFLYPDIVAEIERSKKHKCSYCGKEGATLGCCISQCRKQFHLPCGKERNSMSLFYGNYKSYCQLHAPKQKIPDHIMSVAKLRMKRAKDAKNLKSPRSLSKLKELCADNSVSNESKSEDIESVCVICYEAVDGFPTVQTFWPPCCARDAWFHRTCIQRMALSAGMHYLKCPLCNDKDNFYEAVVSQGYYIPDRDAAWELEQNAFAEIYERPLSCSADDCQCPMGRNHDADMGWWDIKLCLLCGTSGVHAQCLTNAGSRRYVCGTCRPHAPADLDTLATSIEAVILEEQSRNTARTRRGPVMPSRMSLRRTKQTPHYNNTPSTSRSNLTTQTEKTESDDQAPKDVTSSRLELNLKTPRKPPENPKKSEMPIFIEPTILKTIENTLLSPIKLLEQRFHEKIQCMDVKEIKVDTNEVLKRVREKFKKPRPLCEKKRIINEILNSLFETKENFKTKEPMKEWNTPKKCCDVSDEIFQEPTGIHGTPKLTTDTKTEPFDYDIINSQKLPVEPPKITIIEDETQFFSSNTVDNVHEENQIHSLNDSSLALKTIDGVETQFISSNTEETAKNNIHEEINFHPLNETSDENINIEENSQFIPSNVEETARDNIHEETEESHFHPINVTSSASRTVESSTKIEEETQSTTNVEETAKDNLYEGTEESQFYPLNDTSSVSLPFESPINIEEESQFNPPNVEETVKDIIIEETKIRNEENESSSSTFQLPPEFVADNISDDSLQLCDTPKKLKTVEIQKDSSLEISENDQVVSIDVFKIENNDSNDFIKLDKPKPEKFVLKFSPLHSKVKSDNDIDLESFKNYYLNEVERDNFQCTYSHKHKHLGDKEGLCTGKLKTAIDFAISACHEDTKNSEKLKRKIESTDYVPKKKRIENKNVDGKDAETKDDIQKVKGINLAFNKKENALKKKRKKLQNKDAEINFICSNDENKNVEQIDLTVNTTNENTKKKSRKSKKNKKSSVRSTIQVKIRLKKEQVRLKITKSKQSNKLHKEKNKEHSLKNLKQYILTSPEANSKSSNIIAKPENDIPLIKKKYPKQKKSTDNMKQTSIQNFFKIKTPE